jgi:hypothetical protein
LTRSATFLPQPTTLDRLREESVKRMCMGKGSMTLGVSALWYLLKVRQGLQVNYNWSPIRTYRVLLQYV